MVTPSPTDKTEEQKGRWKTPSQSETVTKNRKAPMGATTEDQTSGDHISQQKDPEGRVAGRRGRESEIPEIQGLPGCTIPIGPDLKRRAEELEKNPNVATENNRKRRHQCQTPETNRRQLLNPKKYI